jgi:hypothetical protein
MTNDPRVAFSKHRIDPVDNELRLYRESWGEPSDAIKARMRETEEMLNAVRVMLASAHPNDLESVEDALEKARTHWKKRLS